VELIVTIARMENISLMSNLKMVRYDVGQRVIGQMGRNYNQLGCSGLSCQCHVSDVVWHDAVTTRGSTSTVSGYYRFIIPSSKQPTQPRGAPEVGRAKPSESDKPESSAAVWYSKHVGTLVHTLAVLVSAVLLT